ncbi:hypothetical protein [Aeromicrobium ginsengisoli]|uniref:Uncharacterized protein n=1 Tax=Aeromicrobium ginsengisoli TaxID=363867 RepID=A0A5M4FI00_9ACTN|nr:hypothetical protein [Aeromicrobium ginsengisoli]KAA1399588.1 hypothetical protein ESP70_002145 [Aeromicrobium ginsengisoli]
MSIPTRTTTPPTLDSALTERLLNASLLLAPLAYIAVDSSYAVRGWDDGPTAAMHIIAAALYGIAAIKLVSMTSGRTQAILLVVAVLGVVGNAGVGENTLHVALGGNDLFDANGPANVFKTLGFFFPLTFLVAAFALRTRTPAWWPALLSLGAALFPIAHVANISWLAVIDAVLMLLALGTLTRVIRR